MNVYIWELHANTRACIRLQSWQFQGSTHIYMHTAYGAMCSTSLFSKLATWHLVGVTVEPIIMLVLNYISHRLINRNSYIL